MKQSSDDIALVEGNNELNVEMVPLKDRFYVPAKMDVVVTDGDILGMYWNCDFSVLITNKGDVPGTHIINWWDSVDVNIGSRQITLQPGESYLWTLSQWVDFGRVGNYYIWLQGDWIGDNLSEGHANRYMVS